MHHSSAEHSFPTRLSEVAPQGDKTSLFSGTWQGNTRLTWFSELGERSAEELSISVIFKCKVLWTPCWWYRKFKRMDSKPVSPGVITCRKEKHEALFLFAPPSMSHSVTFSFKFYRIGAVNHRSVNIKMQTSILFQYACSHIEHTIILYFAILFKNCSTHVPALSWLLFTWVLCGRRASVWTQPLCLLGDTWTHCLSSFFYSLFYTTFFLFLSPFISFLCFFFVYSPFNLSIHAFFFTYLHSVTIFIIPFQLLSYFPLFPSFFLHSFTRRDYFETFVITQWLRRESLLLSGIGQVFVSSSTHLCRDFSHHLCQKRKPRINHPAKIILQSQNI